MKHIDLFNEFGLEPQSLYEFEKAGLLPQGTSALTEFPDESAVLIKRFCLLKMLSLNVNDISDINSGTTDFSAKLSERVSAILNDRDNITQAAIVLQNIRREKEDFFTFDPDPYLEHISELKHSGGVFYDVNSGLLPREGYTNSYTYGRTKPQNSWYIQGSGEPNPNRPDPNFGPTGRATGNEYSENSTGKNDNRYFYNSYETRSQVKREDKPGTCPRPFRRYLARNLDISVTAFLMYFILSVLLHINMSAISTLLAIAAAFAETLIEPLLITFFGTTPGKFVMGIRVTNLTTGNRLTLKEAYIRSVRVLWYGMGAFIPIFSIIREFIAFKLCKAGEQMPWDTDCSVKIKTTSAWRIVFSIILIVVFELVGEIVSVQALIPRNKGDITVEQFYENCAEIISSNKFTIDFPDFKLTTEGNIVKSVQLDYKPDIGEHNRQVEMYIAFMAFAASAKGSNCFTYTFDIAPQCIDYYDIPFTLTYCGVNITNVIDGQEANSQDFLFQILTGMQESLAAMYNTQAPSVPLSYTTEQTFTLSK